MANVTFALTLGDSRPREPAAPLSLAIFLHGWRWTGAVGRSVGRPAGSLFRRFLRGAIFALHVARCSLKVQSAQRARGVRSVPRWRAPAEPTMQQGASKYT